MWKRKFHRWESALSADGTQRTRKKIGKLPNESDFDSWYEFSCLSWRINCCKEKRNGIFFSSDFIPHLSSSSLNYIWVKLYKFYFLWRIVAIRTLDLFNALRCCIYTLVFMHGSTLAISLTNFHQVIIFFHKKNVENKEKLMKILLNIIAYKIQIIKCF